MGKQAEKKVAAPKNKNVEELQAELKKKIAEDTAKLDAAKKAGTKVVGVEESEALQKKGYIVTAMYVKDGKKIHELVKGG